MSKGCEVRPLQAAGMAILGDRTLRWASGVQAKHYTPPSQDNLR